MRPSFILFSLLFVVIMLSCLLSTGIRAKRLQQETIQQNMKNIVRDLALSDLALSTEARYTRHPAVSDALVISMDHPGAIDHFPSTSFWTPLP